MVDANFIKRRQDAPGKPCSTAAAAICKTQNCGIVQLNKGVGESYFDWHGQSCKQDTSRLVNAKGEHVGYIEVVQDLTSIVRSKDYTASEVDRLASNLTKLAQGNFDLDLEVKQADQHTNEAQQLFVKINESLRAAKSAVEAMALDADLLTKAAAEGELSIRADASKHQGEFRNIVEGINLAFETIAAPLVRAIEHLDNLSRGINGKQITRTYKGELQRLTDSFNKVFVSIDALVADSTMLAQAGAEGKLSTRADASKHEGDFRKIVQGVNDTLDAVIGPLKFSAGYVDRISKGDIPEKITDNYNGDFNEIKINLNQCIDAVNALIGDAVMLSKAAVDGKLSTRADRRSTRATSAKSYRALTPRSTPLWNRCRTWAPSLSNSLEGISRRRSPTSMREIMNT